jgi:ABC-type multidrug transport system fused ATPase/permease subunit
MDSEPVAKLNKENLYTGLKVLWKYISQYRKEMLVLSVMGIFSAVGNGTIPYVAGKFFDVVTRSTSVVLFSHTLPVYAAVLILWAVIQIVTYTLDWRINILSEKFSNVIWLDYLSNGFGYLLLLPVSFHKTNKIGEVSNKINVAANALETIAGRIVIDLSPQILSILIAFGITFYLKPLLALFLLGGVLLYIFIFSTKIQHTAQYQKEYWNVLNFVFGESYDVVGNALAIKQATAEQYEINRLSTKMKSAVPLWMRLTNCGAALPCISVLLFSQLKLLFLSFRLHIFTKVL